MPKRIPISVFIAPLLICPTAGISKAWNSGSNSYTERVTTITTYEDHADTQVVYIKHLSDGSQQVFDYKPDETDDGKSDVSFFVDPEKYNYTQDVADWRNYCLDAINMYRAKENVKPLTLADQSKQTCADKQAAADLKANVAHGHFGDCKESAQNTGPNAPLSWLKTKKAAIDYFLEAMWNEKKLVESGKRDPDNEEDFHVIGHYLNMRDASYKSVACGYAISADGKYGWFNTNFYK